MKNTIPDLKWSLHTKEDIKLSYNMFPVEISRIARKFHNAIPGCKMTPLRSLYNLANMLGVESIWVKDESQRLALNSFKVLGGSFAIYRLIQNKLNLNDDEISYENIISEKSRKFLGEITFASATDGNHGMELLGRQAGLGIEA